MNNPVTHWQIVTAEPEKAASFYKRVFGWTISADNAMGYREVKAEDGGIPGGIWPAPASTPTMAQLFIRVADVAVAADTAVKHGATVIVPVTALPDGDVMAILRDPVGLTFGLVRR